MPPVLNQVRRWLAQPTPASRKCLVCHRSIRATEPQMRVQGDAHVHHSCATYRMRQVRDRQARLGYPPR